MNYPAVSMQVACVFVLNPNSELLLLQRHTNDPGGGMWGVPGGKIDTGENERQAALRELHEETGLTADDAAFLGAHIVHMPHGTVHMTTYKVELPAPRPVTINPSEHHVYNWFALDSLRYTENLLWGLPTTLRDFGLLEDLEVDHTLTDGTSIYLL